MTTDAIGLPEPRSTPCGTIRAIPFGDTDELPRHTDVVVIGGGISGVSTAYWLAAAGKQVTLIEKGEIAGESSGKAFGWISDLLLDPAKMELCARSKALWLQLQDSVGELGYRRHGITFLAGTPEDLAFFDQWRASVGGVERPDISLLTPAQVKERLPSCEGEVTGGLHSSTDGAAEPRLAAVTVAKAARALGARIVTGCAARGLDVASGRVGGVFTEHGRVACESVVYAGNYWSRLFFGNLGLSVPQLYVVSSLCRIGPLANGPVGAGGTHAGAWRRQIDGAYTIGRLMGSHAAITRDAIQLFGQFLPALKAEWRSMKLSFDGDARRDWLRPRRWSMAQETPFERERVLGTVVDRAIGSNGLRSLQRDFPAFRSADVVEHWSGPLTMTPDNMPIASRIDGIPNLYLITGCSYGFTWAPALGELIADLVLERTPRIDPSPFRFSRFSDGTKLRVAQ